MAAVRLPGVAAVVPELPAASAARRRAGEPITLPKRLLLRLGGGDATSVVSSNLGVVNPAASRPEGTDAEYFAMKIVYPGMTEAMMRRFGGAVFPLGNSTQTCLCLGHCLSAGPSQSRMTFCGNIFRAS